MCGSDAALSVESHNHPRLDALSFFVFAFDPALGAFPFLTSLLLLCVHGVLSTRVLANPVVSCLGGQPKQPTERTLRLCLRFFLFLF